MWEGKPGICFAKTSQFTQSAGSGGIALPESETVSVFFEGESQIRKRRMFLELQFIEFCLTSIIRPPERSEGGLIN